MTIPSPLPVARWQVLLTPAASGVRNMATDVALMQHARDTGEGVFRVYSWSEPTISFGRNQSAAGRYDRARILSAGVAVVRRPTGGRSILHHREITYSVTAPTAGTGVRDGYASINAVLRATLRRLGTETRVVEDGRRASRPGAAPCFSEPGRGELTADGRKLVGSAQWQDRGALLQHGSILVENDQQMLNSFLITPESAMPIEPATLRSVLGRTPEPAEVAAGIRATLAELLGEDVQEMPAEVALDGGRGFEQLFADEAWTWRR